MGLGNFVDAAKKFRAAPKHSFSPQALEGRSVVIIDAEAKNPANNLSAEEISWEKCRHLVPNPSRQLCRQFGCVCRQKSCPPKYHL